MFDMRKGHTKIRIEYLCGGSLIPSIDAFLKDMYNWHMDQEVGVSYLPLSHVAAQVYKQLGSPTFPSPM